MNFNKLIASSLRFYKIAVKGMNGAMHNKLNKMSYPVVDITNPGYNALLGRYLLDRLVNSNLVKITLHGVV
ncbi:MAG: hypothetical protein PHF63_06060 [Herbinix sp.]|nr:hypothetical protein [Herbinix sp.]